MTEFYSKTPTTIFIRWNELPLENRRGILEWYMVLWLPVGVTDYVSNYKHRFLPLHPRTFTITGLQPFTRYYLGVLPTNGAGFYIQQSMTKNAIVATTQEDGKRFKRLLTEVCMEI